MTMTRPSARSGLRALAPLVVVASLLAGGVAPSVAQDVPEPDPTALQVSRDGLLWQESITTPLFDPEIRWVPGDERVARFFVRNTRDDAGDLRVVLQRPERSALIDTGSLTIAARADGGRWVEVASGGRHVLVDEPDVGSRTRMLVELRAAMDFDAPNQTMVLASDLDLDITLTQSGVVADATSDNNSGSDFFADGGSGSSGDPDDPNSPGGPTADAGDQGFLPDTGSVLRPWVLPLALLLLAAGAVLLARRRAEEEERVPPEDLEASLRLHPPQP